MIGAMYTLPAKFIHERNTTYKMSGLLWDRQYWLMQALPRRGYFEFDAANGPPDFIPERLKTSFKAIISNHPRSF